MAKGTEEQSVDLQIHGCQAWHCINRFIETKDGKWLWLAKAYLESDNGYIKEIHHHRFDIDDLSQYLGVGR